MKTAIPATMPKAFLFGFVLITSINSHAQISKCKVLVGGNLAYAKSDAEINGGTSSFNAGTFEIAGGFAFRENQVLGLKFSYSPSRQRNIPVAFNDTLNRRSDQYSAGVFYRKYRPLGRGRFLFFGEGEASYIGGRQTEKYSSQSADIITRTRGGALGITPGLAYGISKRVQFELTIPRLIAAQYVKLDIHSAIPGISPSESKNVYLTAGFSNGNILSNLGVGFRLLL